MKVLNNIINTIMKKTEETIDYLNLEPMQQAKQLYDEGKDNEAYEAFYAIVTEQPENGYAHYYMAMILKRRNLLGEALKAFNNAVKLLQDDKEWLSFCFTNRARLYESLGDKDQVLLDLEEAIRISPECAYAVGIRARFYQDTEQYDLSDQDYKRLIELRPEEAQPYYGIGLNAFLQEKYDDAKAHLEYAIKLDPNAGISATPIDITDNPHNIEFQEVEAAQLPSVLNDVDYAVINSNYAIDAGLKPTVDGLGIENSASAYVNILVVNEGNEDTDEAKALSAALESQQVYDFITENYDGGVVPVVENRTDGYDSSVDYDALKGVTVSVAASPTPHAQILEVAKEILAEIYRRHELKLDRASFEKILKEYK